MLISCHSDCPSTSQPCVRLPQTEWESGLIEILQSASTICKLFIEFTARKSFHVFAIHHFVDDWKLSGNVEIEFPHLVSTSTQFTRTTLVWRESHISVRLFARSQQRENLIKADDWLAVRTSFDHMTRVVSTTHYRRQNASNYFNSW